MATDMTSALREFAFKKLQEAKQKGATLANASAATASATLADTAASLSKLSSSAPVASAGGFTLRTHSPSAPPQPSAVPTREQHLRKLRGANSDVRTAVAASSSAALSESVYKMDLINESLAFTIENIQECSHVMALLNRQLKDSAGMGNPAHKDFYCRSSRDQAAGSNGAA